MRWLDLGLRMVLLGTLFFYLMVRTGGITPIVELCLAIIMMSQPYLLTNFQDNQTEPAASGSRKWLRIGLYVLYTSLIIVSLLFFPLFFFFIPLFYSQLMLTQVNRYFWFLLPLGAFLVLNVTLYECFFVTGLCLWAAFLHTIIQNSLQFEETSYLEIDTLRHLNQRIKIEQKNLLLMQDERLTTTMLAERKRIVEEIHDSLGHQLSSAVIQMAALQYTVDDPEARATLEEIKGRLSTGMENVRHIIHTERQSAVDLETELRHLVESFTKCRIHFAYQNTVPLNNPTTHSVVNIVKEALTNINKHSNATHVSVRFSEMEDKWTLLMLDNGTVSSSGERSQSGIGLINIEERVHAMGGTLHINDQNGFRIFISIPQRGLSNESVSD